MILVWRMSKGKRWKTVCIIIMQIYEIKRMIMLLHPDGSLFVKLVGLRRSELCGENLEIISQHGGRLVTALKGGNTKVEICLLVVFRHALAVSREHTQDSRRFPVTIGRGLFQYLDRFIGGMG